MSDLGVFGVRFRGAELPGLVAGIPAGAPVVDVEVVSQAAIDACWAQAKRPERLFARQLEGGDDIVSVDRDPEVGFRIWARYLGTHLVAADGSWVSSVLAEGPEWHGTRLLASQVFPLVALLHGREVLHAGAAVIDERLLAVTAPSGTGKSSTIGHLIAGGAGFFADDSLALAADPATGRITAFPGPRILSIAREQLATMSREGGRRLGRRLGEEGKTYLEPESASGPLPLGALVFLERTTDSTSEDVTSSVVDWQEVLASAGQPWWRDRARVGRQLDIAFRLSATVPVLRRRIGPSESAPEVARRLVAELAPTARWPARLPG